MAAYQIDGGYRLSGSINVSGSKNASLPIMSATLLASEPCLLRNVPDIVDVRNFIEILKGLGSKITFENHVLSIDNSSVNSFAPAPALAKKLRGSILLLGPLLSRFNKVIMPFPGGDLIGKRQIDTHLMALGNLGAKVLKNGYVEITAAKLLASNIILNEISVTATENAIMAAVKASGTTKIHLAAAEPHVQDLCLFLNSMGAKISGIGSHDLIIKGVKKLRGAEHRIIFDNEVAVSLMNLAAATKSELLIDHIQPDYLSSAIIQLRLMNVNFEISKNAITIKRPLGPYRAVKIKPNIYPGLLTDYVPPFAVLATQAKGLSLVHEWMYEGRLGYIHELAKMGARARILDPHRAEIEGPCAMHGTNISSLDIRSGIVLVIAALTAKGKTVLHDIQHIDRGYENIDLVLCQVGARIERI